VKKLGLGSQQGKLAEDELLKLMVDEPNLIKRPLIIANGQLVAGFDKVAKPKLGEILDTEF
jgi:arsenate reductase-like glutaredoxin family protein